MGLIAVVAGWVLTFLWRCPRVGRALTFLWGCPRAGWVLTFLWGCPRAGRALTFLWRCPRAGRALTFLWRCPRAGRALTFLWRCPRAGRALTFLWGCPRAGRALTFCQTPQKVSKEGLPPEPAARVASGARVSGPSGGALATRCAQTGEGSTPPPDDPLTRQAPNGARARSRSTATATARSRSTTTATTTAIATSTAAFGALQAEEPRAQRVDVAMAKPSRRSCRCEAADSRRVRADLLRGRVRAQRVSPPAARTRRESGTRRPASSVDGQPRGTPFFACFL